MYICANEINLSLSANEDRPATDPRQTRDRPATNQVMKRHKKRGVSTPLCVGIARFELTTSCSQSRHSNRAELYPVAFFIRKRAQRYCFFLTRPNKLREKERFRLNSCIFKINYVTLQTFCAAKPKGDRYRLITKIQ